MPRLLTPSESNFPQPANQRDQHSRDRRSASASATTAGPDGVSFNAGVEACRSFLKSRDLRVDATGTYRLGMTDPHLGDVAGRNISHGCLARSLWFTMRCRGQRVSEATLQTVFVELAMREADQRYRLLTSRLIGTPATPEGRDPTPLPLAKTLTIYP